jgi:hypothetical protein
VHHAEMIPQFKRGRTSRSAVLAARGLAIFAAGLFKKVVIADNLAQFVSPVFAHLDAGGGVTAPWAWLATLAYSLQIYFDFSGYSDMAVGLALLFGIRLPVNFRSPYQALSIVEFWRRWHITLSRFLRDYLYIPLGGNRLGEQRRYINLMVTMLLGGLWHGAGWNFLVWGGLHGACLSINHLWREWRGGARVSARAFSSEVETGSRQENASNQESRAPFRFNRNGKGSGVPNPNFEPPHQLVVVVPFEAGRGGLRRRRIGGIDQGIGGDPRRLGGPDLGQQNRYRARKRLGLLQVGIHRNRLHLGILAERAHHPGQAGDRRRKLDLDHVFRGLQRGQLRDDAVD